MLDSIKKNAKGIALMVISATCLCLGQLIWKMMPGVQILPLIAGFALYGVGALVMIVAFKFGSLSVLQPMNSISYILSAILAYFVLGESISLQKGIAIIVIMAGVLLLAGGESDD